MEQVLEKEEIEQKNETINEKKHIKILGITSWRLFAYFIIYSVIGFIVETLFGIAKYGTLESRQSFLYGPFCAIYGIGAIIMILFLQYFKKKLQYFVCWWMYSWFYYRIFSELDRGNNFTSKMVGLF